MSVIAAVCAVSLFLFPSWDLSVRAMERRGNWDVGDGSEDIMCRVWSEDDERRTREEGKKRRDYIRLQE